MPTSIRVPGGGQRWQRRDSTLLSYTRPIGLKIMEQHNQPDKDACDLPAQPTPTARCVSLLCPPQRVQSQPPLLFWFQ